MPGFQGIHLGAEHGTGQRRLPDQTGIGGAAAQPGIGDGGQRPKRLVGREVAQAG